MPRATNYTIFNTTCYELRRTNTTWSKLSGTNTTCYEASCRKIIGHRWVEKSVQLAALHRQVAPPALPIVGHRRIETSMRLCHHLAAGHLAKSDIGYWASMCEKLVQLCTSIHPQSFIVLLYQTPQNLNYTCWEEFPSAISGSQNF